MHLSWTSVFSAGVFIMMNPWSNTFFRAAGCWLARIAPKNWSRPLAVLLAFFLAFSSLPVQGQMQRRPSRSGSRGGGGGTLPSDVLAGAVVSFKGKLRAVDKKSILIESSEDQIVSFHRSKKTKFLSGDKPIKPEEIPLEEMVTVDASKDSVGDLVAVDIIWKKS
jgi:hypothetical protein